MNDSVDLNFNQTVIELLNYTYERNNVWIMYEGLYCSKTFIPKNQLGEKYIPEKHNDLKVISWSLANRSDLEGKIIIFVKAKLDDIPLKLQEHCKGKSLKAHGKEQLSIYDLGELK